MSAVWPTFAFPFPPDRRELKKAERKAARRQKRPERYRSGEWAQQCSKDLDLWLTMNHSNEFTCEDFKTWCLRKLGRKAPHHGSVWGAMWMAAFKQGKIEKVATRTVACETYKGRYKRQANIWKRKYK